MLVSDCEEEAHARRIPTVLILVLVDVGLGLANRLCSSVVCTVLILVLVDVGLGRHVKAFRKRLHEVS